MVEQKAKGEAPPNPYMAPPLRPTPKIIKLLSLHLGDSGHIRSEGQLDPPFYRPEFPGKGLMTIANVYPFRVVGGLIFTTIWHSQLRFVVAEDMEYGFGHPVKLVEQQIYYTSEFNGGDGQLFELHPRKMILRPSIEGINPFTDESDKVERITHILIYNPYFDPLRMFHTDAVTMSLVLEVPNHILDQM